MFLLTSELAFRSIRRVMNSLFHSSSLFSLRDKQELRYIDYINYFLQNCWFTFSNKYFISYSFHYSIINFFYIRYCLVSFPRRKLIISHFYIYIHWIHSHSFLFSLFNLKNFSQTKQLKRFNNEKIWQKLRI